jgi:hypothetical protein
MHGNLSVMRSLAAALANAGAAAIKSGAEFFFKNLCTGSWNGAMIRGSAEEDVAHGKCKLQVRKQKKTSKLFDAV